MSIKKTTETTSSKILNSDIYDITRFVDDIKKKNIDGVDGDKETLLVGMYGYLGYQFASLLQNAIVTASELSNEAIPTRAKFDRNVITHALSLGVKKVAATAANMKILLMFPEKALRANMIDGKFIFKASTPLNFDEFEFHTDYDIEINYVSLMDVTNGSQRNYVYTAKYIMDNTNPISDIDNPFLPPIAVFNYVEDNMVVLVTNLHQVYYREIYEKVLDSDVIANKTISFSFEKQMSHFIVKVQEPADSENGVEKEVTLIPVYDGLYNQEIANQKYCYYQYINPNTIRIRFDPTNYQPPANSDITIELYTTDGTGGNFEYSEEKTIRLTSDQYTNLYCIIAQRGEDGSCGGLDRQTIEQLQHIIPKEALSRGSITTLTDLRNFFNSLNNENSVLHVFRKEDNILDRVYYVYNLMKDEEYNIVPTNTIPIYLENTRMDNVNGKIYLESGTPIFYYKFGEGANLSLIKDNYIGYLEQKIVNAEVNYAFYNSNGYTTYQGTPTQETLNTWYDEYRNSFDVDRDMGKSYKLLDPKPVTSYDFFDKASIYFKIYWSDELSNLLVPNNDNSLYDNWYFGTCNRCYLNKTRLKLSNASSPTPGVLEIMASQMKNVDIEGRYLTDFELEFTKKDGSVTIVTHYPMRTGEDTIDPVNEGWITVGTGTKEFIVDGVTVEVPYEYPIVVVSNISGVNFYRCHKKLSDGTLTYVDNKCMFPLNFIPSEIPTNLYDSDIYVYSWVVEISFYDESKSFCAPYMYSSESVTRPFLVPDYIINLGNVSEIDRKQYIERFWNAFAVYINQIEHGMHDYLILDSINTIDVYSYDGQQGHSFSDLNLTEGDLIRFDTYRNRGGSSDTFVYTDPTTWTLGEILSIERNDGRVVSIEVLVKDEELGEFNTYRYRLPIPGETDSSSSRVPIDTNCIIVLSKISKFLYTNPLSIVLEDDPTINSHRITASYYLDIIDEVRYQEFDCINSKSPIQFILSSIHTYRSSYLSDNRYKYTISINIKPNTGIVDENMINRTQVIGVFYKKGNDETSESRPIMYSIAKYKGLVNSYFDDNGNEITEDVIADNDGIHYEITLFTKPFATSDKTDISDDNYRVDVIDNNNNIYIGSKQIVEEIRANTDSEQDAIEEFFKQYRMFNADANLPRPLGIDDLPSDFNLDTLSQEYVNTIYLNINTELKIYILYKYDAIPSKYTDGLAREFLAVNTANADALYNSVSQNTKFTQIIPIEPDQQGYVPDYTLKDMVLTNVYNTYQGINLIHDYSNIMNSYVTAIRTNDIFNPDQKEDIESYIVNRVPCVRYFYWNTEKRVLTFLKDMKAKINYVLDAIAPLECTFGLDYKFFNTYGPSNMYHLTDDDGDVTDLIDNVALTMTFRAKFYNEDSDAASMIDQIANTIKNYLEKLDQLDDIHFPNITTLVESEYSQYLIYFEFVSFNIYDATTQHIITNENMEMLSMVPEFLHVDTNDLNGKPYINIRIVTS